MEINKLADLYYNEYKRFMGIMRGTTDLTGLKRVHIRILYALSQMSNKKSVKTASLIGETIGKYHPHGDQSIFDAIETLVKQGLLKGFGNWGNFHMGLEYMKPAAARYTSIGWTPILDYVFEHIKYVPLSEAQIDPIVEPDFLPTPVPLCLINLNNKFSQSSLTTGISPGYRTLYPMFKLKDITQYIIKNIQKDWKYTKDIPLYLGDNVEIISCDKNYMNKNMFSCEIKPVIETDDKTREIHIKAIVNKKLFSQTFIDEISKKCEIFVDLSNPDETDIYMKFSRKNTYDEYKTLFNNKLRQKLKFQVIVNNFEEIDKITLHDWLHTTYLLYKESTEKHIKEKLYKLQEKIDELQLIQKLRPYIQKALSKKDSIKYLLNNLDNSFELDNVKSLLEKYSIKKLLETSLEIDSLQKRKQELENTLRELDTYLIEKYKEIGKLK